MAARELKDCLWFEPITNHYICGLDHNSTYLLIPVVKGGSRSNNEERAPDVLSFGQMSKKGNGLDCLAQAPAFAIQPFTIMQHNRSQ